MRNSLTCLICSFFVISPAFAKQVQLCGNLAQGEFVVGHVTNASKVRFNNKEYNLNKDGEFLLALARDENKNAKLEVFFEDNKPHSFQFAVNKSKWDIQSIKGVAQNKVTPSKSDETEILRERTDVSQALKTNNVNSTDWKKGFILPLKGQISGHFGNQRIFNNIPKSPHSGTDIAAPQDTEIKAAGNGKVLLSGGDYFYSGNMVIVDHGQGLQTIYAHLSRALVKVGDIVKKGDIIGLVGKTGRATGPHLHWGASVNNVRFRPHSLLEYNTKNCITLNSNEESK